MKRLEYQRRQQKGALLLAARKEPKMIESLNKQIAEQDAKIRSLTEEVERLKGEKAVLQESADTLARLRQEAALEVAQALKDGDELKNLEAEWEKLNNSFASQASVDRMTEVRLRMKVIYDLILQKRE